MLTQTKDNYYDTRNLKISFGKSVLSNKLMIDSFDKIIEAIQISPKYQNVIEKVRAEKDKEKRKKIKQNTLPYFNMGKFRNNRRNNENIIETEFMIFDFDHVTDIEEKRKQLENDEKVFCVFTSPSGDGLKIICRLNEKITDPQIFSANYKFHASQFGASLGEKEDHTSGVSFPCYISYDPKLYLNKAATPLIVSISCVDNKDDIKKVKISELLKGDLVDGQRTVSMTRLLGYMIRMRLERAEALEVIRSWNQSHQDKLDDEKIVFTVNDLYNRYQNEQQADTKFTINNNCYYKNGSKGIYQVTSFILQPKELLVLDDRDCLKCDVVTNNFIYENVLLENTDWHSKQRFLKAIGHQDCVFLGSDNDLQSLCHYVQESVPLRKTGVKSIGLYDDVWVTENMNITKDGIQKDLKLVPYDKGADAFYHKISYADEELNLQTFYDNVLKINERNVVLSNVGWVFATPIKPIITELGDGFPILFNHGGQGTGKSSMAQLFIRLMGYTDIDPKSCTMKSFPMLKMLSSTNAIPQWYDEFKKTDMKEADYDNLLRYMRRVYKGEVEEKGRPDQTVESYRLTAPMAVMGEWNINQPAIMERVIIVRTTDVIKKNIEMQNAFGQLKELKLESFIPRYVQFCLNQNIRQMFLESCELVKTHFKGKEIAPRIINNLAVLTLGVKIFMKYADENLIELEEVNYNELLDYQLQQITGSNSGMVRSAVDQLMEELSVMAERRDITSSSDYKFLELDMVKCLAIRFNKIFPQFKEYARKTNYEGDLIDKSSYVKLFDDCEYVHDKNRSVKFSDSKTYRCLVIDLEKAVAAGINLEGFVK